MGKLTVKSARASLTAACEARLETLERFKKYPGALNGLEESGILSETLTEPGALEDFLDALQAVEDDAETLRLRTEEGTFLWDTAEKVWIDEDPSSSEEEEELVEEDEDGEDDHCHHCR